MNVTNKKSWTKKSDDTTITAENNLPRENWSMAQISNSTNNWTVKNNWIEMVESADVQKQPTTHLAQNNTSSNFGPDTNSMYNVHKIYIKYIKEFLNVMCCMNV